MVSLGEAKVHLRLDTNAGSADPSFEADQDAEILRLISAAADHLTSIDVNVSADPLPPALHHAILMLVAHFYENREAAGESMQVTPLGVSRLIAPYRSHQL